MSLGDELRQLLGSDAIADDAETLAAHSGDKWFAAHQPFTVVVDSLRALLTGAPVGNTPYLALAWCVAIAVVAYLWAQAAFRRGAR